MKKWNSKKRDENITCFTKDRNSLCTSETNHFRRPREDLSAQGCQNGRWKGYIWRYTEKKAQTLWLPAHQCGKCGEALDGHTFLFHIDSLHNGFCPTGSLINASPYRYWLLWYNDENFLRFKENRNPNYIKADPPWLI